MRRRLLLVAAALGAGCGGDVPGEVPTPADLSHGTLDAPESTEAPGVDTTAAPQAEETTTSEAAAARTLDMTFTGDNSFTHGLVTSADSTPYAEVASLLAADVTIGNLETAVGVTGVPEEKEFTFQSPPESGAVLAAAGFDAVSLANNHALDYGRDALVETIANLDAAGVAHAGGGADTAQAFTPARLDRNGVRISFFGFTRVWSGEFWSALPDRPGLAGVYEPEAAVAAVAAERPDTDVLLVMLHSGFELQHCPAEYQPDLLRGLAEAGADVVVSAHPHVLNGFERHDGRLLAYSLGNFAFPSARGNTAMSAVLRVRWTEGTTDAWLTPVTVSGGVPRPVDAAEATAIREMVSNRSWGLMVGEDGAIVPGTGPDIECGETPYDFPSSPPPPRETTTTTVGGGSETTGATDPPSTETTTPPTETSVAPPPTDTTVTPPPTETSPTSAPPAETSPTTAAT